MTSEEFAKAQAISDSYLRLRDKLAPWGAHDTNHGGANRFEKTEEALDRLLAERPRFAHRGELVAFVKEMRRHVTLEAAIDQMRRFLRLEM